MNIDPLGDTIPARHAIESDEEEDEYNPLSFKFRKSEQFSTIDIKIIGNAKKGQRLVVATGHAAMFWARGANLGEQSSTVMVNGVQVGLLFQPAWTMATVLVSETATKLPLWIMHAYAKFVIDALEPLSLALLDSYPTPSYISSDRIYDAPVRYLCADEPPRVLTTTAQPYSPPNLVQSTTASFLTVFKVHRSALHNDQTRPYVAILLPSPFLYDPPPKELKATKILSSADADFEEWLPRTMKAAQDCLFGFVGELVDMTWENKSGHGRGIYTSVRQKNEIGDGGMYI